MTTTTDRKPPPKFVTNEWAWEQTLARLEEQGKLDEHGNPVHYGAATAIYKAIVKKYGNMDVPDAFARNIATRSDMLELKSEAWTVSRGSAWGFGTDVTRRIWPKLTFREAKHPLAPLGMKIVEAEPMFEFELARTDTTPDEWPRGLMPVTTALWLTEDSDAQKWVRGEIETMLGTIDDAIAEAAAQLLEVGGVEIDTRFVDNGGTIAALKATVCDLEEALGS